MFTETFSFAFWHKKRAFQAHESVVNMELASKHVHLGGYCHHEYLSVKKSLLKMLQEKTEENVQLCVFVDGECVVDLCGTSTADFGHDRDKLQVCKSFGPRVSAKDTFFSEFYYVF